MFDNKLCVVCLVSAPNATAPSEVAQPVAVQSQQQPKTLFSDSVASSDNVNPVRVQNQPSTSKTTKRQRRKYISTVCVCGYDAKIKSKLERHQKEGRCSMLPRTARADFVCTMCGFTNTYMSMMAHLTYFKKASEAGTMKADSKHAGYDAAHHRNEIIRFQKEFGKKK